MKKFFTLALVAMATASNVSAKQVIPASFNNMAEDGSVAAWAWCQYDLSKWEGEGESAVCLYDYHDASEYDYLVMKLDNCTAGFKFMLYKSDWATSVVSEYAGGSTLSAISLMDGAAADWADNLAAIVIHPTGHGIIKISEVSYVSEEEYKVMLEEDKNKEKMLDKLESPMSVALSGGEDNYGWNTPGWFGETGLDANYKTIVVEVSEAAANFQITLQDWNGSEGDNHTIQCGAVKDNPAVIAFNIADFKYPGVGQIAVQNANQVGVYTKEDGSEGSMLGDNKVVVSRIYYTSAEVASNYPAPAAYETGIQAIQTEAQETAAYNVVGKRAQKNAKGILFVGGKKIINL